MFNFLHAPKPAQPELKYIVTHLTNEPGKIDYYRKVKGTLESLGYEVIEGIPPMTPEDAGRFKYGIKLELREWPPIADKLLGTLDDMADDPLFKGWETYDPLAEMMAKTDAYFKALELEFRKMEYDILPSKELLDELVELAKGIHPYPLNPNDPIYW